MPLSVRYALWCKFLFLGVENQPVGVVFGVGELPSADGLGGKVIVPVVLYPCCWGVGLVFLVWY